MNRPRRVLAGVPFQMLVFLLGCVLFGWPLLSIADRPGDLGLLRYLYGSWAVLIALLAAAAWGAGGGRRADVSGDEADCPGASGPDGDGEDRP